MSFSAGGQIKYTITVEDAQAASALKSTGQQFKELGASTQSATQQMQAMPQTFQTIVQEGNKVTSTTKQIQQTMQGTVTTVTTATKSQQSFGDVLKNNVLSISVAASSIIGLVSQYTSLRKAQIAAEKAAVAEVTTRNKVIDLTNKLAATISKYGANSTQAAKGARDLEAAQAKAAIAADRNEVIQASLNERIAEFAVNILPNVIGSVGSVIQVLQGFSKAETVSTVTTVENTAAQVANAAAMKLSGTATKGMVGPLKAVSAAEIGAGTAAKGMGLSIKGALIGTGIGAIIVAIGTALVAFTQNWWGVRDAVNAAGVELGKMFPILVPLLNGLKEVGNWIIKIFGGEVPGATAAATEGMAEFGDAADQSAQDAIKAAEEIASAWKKTVDDLIVLPGAVHKEWKEQFQKLRKLGFTKGGIHELKDQFFRPAGIAKSITDTISEALQIVGKTKISGKALKGWANNMIEQINKGIKDAKGQLDFMSTLVDLIKANKKNVNLPKLVAEWFNGLPAALKAKLTDMGIDTKTIITNLGFNAATLGPAISSELQAALKTAFSSPTGIISKGTGQGIFSQDTIKNALGISTTGGGGGWLSKIIESIKTAFSPANLESVRQKLVAGILAAPSNIAALAKQFIDPVIADILNAGVATLTQTIPDWIARTFTAKNFLAGLKMVGDLGTQFVTGLWAIISEPKETAKQINKFVTNTVNAIAAWFTVSFPKTAAALGKVGAGIIEAIGDPKTLASSINTFVVDSLDAIVAWFEATLPKSIPKLKALGAKIVDAVKAGFVESLANNPVWTWIPGFGSVGKIGATISQNIAKDKSKPVTQTTTPKGTSILDESGTTKFLQDAWKNFTGMFPGPQFAEGAMGGGKGGIAGGSSNIKTGSQAGAYGGPGKTSNAAPQINIEMALKQVDIIAKRIASLSSIQAIINVVNNEAIALVDAVAKRIMSLSTIQAAISITNSEAIKLVDAVAKRIDSLTQLNPSISLQNNDAIKMVDVVAKRIDSLEKIQPQINLQNKDAIKMVDVVAKRIDGLEKINPEILLKTGKALKQIDAIANRIQDLPDGEVTIHVKTVGGAISAQKGLHAYLQEDTTIMAHKGERVDISHSGESRPSGNMRGGGGGGSGGGDIIVNNLIDLGSDRIIRSFKRRLGSDRYTFGG